MIKKYKGTRTSKPKNNQTITIFLWSFVYPVSTGGLKRMELFLNWANETFENVNIIIPSSSFEIQEEIIKSHCKMCDNLFIIKRSSKKNLMYTTINFAYKLIVGKFPSFTSPLFIDKIIVESFSLAMKQIKTDYFFNTRHNYAGLVKYLSSSIKSIIDTQDIYKELNEKYYIKTNNKLLRNILSGYREKGDLLESEAKILSKYFKIIAISETDYRKYKKLKSLENKTVKIESVGIKIAEKSVTQIYEYKYDVLIVSSDFPGPREGINWLFEKVFPHININISLAVVGSISNYILNKTVNLKNVNLNILGVVESVDYYYNNSKIVVISILEGTGTSVKAIEALSFGAAIVSTTAGVRFGDVISDFHCLISDEPKEFASYITQLITDENKRHKLGTNALEFAKKKFSVESALQELNNIIE